MRIIGGKYKGLPIKPPSNLPVRPTTDLSKESVFNILCNHFDFATICVLDLFSGTGNMSFEFASRGTQDITTVDRDFGCCDFIKNISEKHEFNLKVIKQDVFKFIQNYDKNFDIIFADPPYNSNDINKLPVLIFEKKLINNSGWLIIEHSNHINLDIYPYFSEKRKYGQSHFSIFKKNS